jgi:hypothetical protein
MRALMAAGEASAMHVVVENRLGVEAAMELDFGDHLNLVKLPSGTATPVVKPLPSFPLREGDAVVSADALPHTLLLLDIQQAALTGWLAGLGASGSTISGNGSGAEGSAEEGGSAAHDTQASQLYCTVRLESSKPATKAAGTAAGTAAGAAGAPGSPGKPSPASSQRSMHGSSAKAGPAAPLRTRALGVGSGGVVTWQERLVLALPMRPGVGEQTLVFEVWDAAARGGRGSSLGCGRLAVPVRLLQHREEHTAELSWEAPAAAAPAGGEGGGAPAAEQPGAQQAGQDAAQQNAAQQGTAQQGSKQQGSVRLQLSYMLQKQWSFSKSGAGPAVPDSWAADSTAGQRALSLASHPGSWAVVPAFGQQKGSGSAAAGISPGVAGAATASLIPLKIGGEGLVVESSVAHVRRPNVLFCFALVGRKAGWAQERGLHG